jgi:NFU1 iron-sulfur cluster scaffold homolog, mitochondrial
MYLQGDGGDIEVIALNGKELQVRYQGACGTCPSSTSATLEAIQGILQEQFDPEIQIVPV